MFTTTSLSELNHFNNWSAEFYIKFAEFKNLVRHTPELAIEKIKTQLSLSISVTDAFTIAREQKKETAFGSTIINKAVSIVQGTKPFNSKDPTLLVALLYILNLITDKSKLLIKQQQLQEELTKLNELLERI